MRCLIVCETLFGNTGAIAEAIAAGVRTYGEARVVHPDECGPDALERTDLLVVGTPTHAWGLPRRRTWVIGNQPAAHDGPFVRQWLDTLPGGRGRAAAAFATRLDRSQLLTGSAAGGVARRLRRRHWHLISEPHSFLVAGMDGPLCDGEFGKAKHWGEELGRAAARPLAGNRS